MNSLIQTKSSFALAFLCSAALSLGTNIAQAQVGSGWTQYSPSKEYNSGMSQSQRYSISGNVEHFWTYTTDTDEFPGNDSGPRSEWRVVNDYTTGSQQFQGDLNPENGTSSYTCFQIFGATSQATSIQLQMRSGNGTLRHYDDTALATGCWGIYTRVNVLHYPVSGGTGSIEVWINGSKVGTFNDGGDVNHYFKYGVYDTPSATSYVGDYWRGASYFKGGNSSGGGSFSGWYQIQDSNSGKDAAVQGAATTNGAPVILWTFGSAQNDEWELTATDSGYYKIVNRHSGLVLAVQGASTSQGAAIIQWSYGSAQNDQWQPVSVGSGLYKLVNRHSGLVLDVKGAATSNGTIFDQWGYNGGANQQFQLISSN